jgi:hypothetical protein
MACAITVFRIDITQYPGYMEAESRNMEQAIKHWSIAASAGDYDATIEDRESINSTLKAYNNSWPR